MDVGRVWLNHVKSSCYFSFVLILLLCFTSFFASITYCHGFATSITVLAHKSWCHNPIVGVVKVRNACGFVVKVKNIVYDKERLLQAMLEETTIWATHDARENDVGVSELFQQDNQQVTSC